MSTANRITAGELMEPANRRRFLSFLGAAPTLAAFAGAELLSSPSAFAATGPLDASERRHRAFVIRRDAAIYQRDRPAQTSTANGDDIEGYVGNLTRFLPDPAREQAVEITPSGSAPNPAPEPAKRERSCIASPT